MKMKEYTVHGVYGLTNTAGLRVSIDEDGEAIHWQLTILDSEKPQKWHRAKIYDTAKGRFYFKYGRMRIYLDEVMRV